MPQNHNLPRFDPLDIQSLPKRPDWDNRPFNFPESITALKAAEALQRKWNMWTDRVMAILRNMHIRSEMLDLTDEDCIPFIHKFQNLPPRPQIEQDESYENRLEEQGFIDFLRLPLWQLYMLWENFGDELEKAHAEYATELSKHRMLGIDDIGLSRLSLTAGTTSGFEARKILGSILVPDRPVDARLSTAAPDPTEWSLGESFDSISAYSKQVTEKKPDAEHFEIRDLNIKDHKKDQPVDSRPSITEQVPTTWSLGENFDSFSAYSKQVSEKKPDAEHFEIRGLHIKDHKKEEEAQPT